MGFNLRSDCVGGKNPGAEIPRLSGSIFFFSGDGSEAPGSTRSFHSLTLSWKLQIGDVQYFSADIKMLDGVKKYSDSLLAC